MSRGSCHAKRHRPFILDIRQELHDSAALMAIASAVGGLVDAVVSNSPRVVKTRAQMKLPTGLTSPADLMRGLPLYGAMSATGNLWCYTVAHVIKSQMRDAQGQTTLAGALAGGIASGMSETLITNPGRRLLVRQALAGKPQPLHEAARELLKTEGWVGLWRGAPVAAVRNGVAWGVFFGTLHPLRDEEAERSAARDMLQSSVACTAACLVGAPFDTVVTHLQSQGAQSLGFAQTVASIAARQGARAFYAGTTARTGQALPLATVGFLVMMQVLALLQKRASEAATPAK